MGTKKKVIEALRKHSPLAVLYFEDSHYAWCAQIEAPKGCHWEADVHCRVTNEWFIGTTPKSEYWDAVIETIRELPKAIPCTDNDCEGIEIWGECEYWNEDK